MEVLVSVVREEVEIYRGLKLAPVLEQEKQLLSAIDRSYNQIHYANSIVTGHLASIAKVHDAQSEFLKKFGLEGLREDTAETLSNLSKDIAKFTQEAKNVEGKLPEIEKTINDWDKELDKILRSGSSEKKKQDEE